MRTLRWFLPAGKGRAGFTLIELIVTLALMSLVFVCAWQSLAAQRDTYRAQEQMSDIQQNIRVALDAITRDLRMAGARAPEGVGPIVQAAPFQLLLLADANGSCLCGLQKVAATEKSYRIQVAEDVCWGGFASFSYLSTPPTHVTNWPPDCPLPSSASPPWYGTDGPLGITWYGQPVSVDVDDAQRAHAELIGWTMDHPWAAPNANPTRVENGIDSIEQADEARVSLATCGGASAITPANDKDWDLSASDGSHNLFNIYRWVKRDPRAASAGADAFSAARVAAGIVGPCDATRPQDGLTVPNPWPLFAYWIDTSNGEMAGQDGKITNNCDGAITASEDTLWGDTNGDCKFTVAEYDALAPVTCTSPASPATCNLLNIVRVDIHLRGESSQKNVDVTGPPWRFRYLDGSVWIRKARGNER